MPYKFNPLTASLDFYEAAASGVELLVNKSTNTALGTSDTLYPTQKAVKTYVDNSGGVTQPQAIILALVFG
jgi:hypothetical protein